jgi:ATP-dependent RNA helicase RhlE
MSFDNLGLSPILLHNLHDLGYRVPTPVQVKAIPLALEGRDLLGSAQTGTGKTAAFGLPMIERLVLRRADSAGASLAPRKPLALVLTPTRELALQVSESLRDLGRKTGLRTAAIFGGVGMQPQVETLKRGVHVVVATPGRLMDHMEQRTIDLSAVQILTVDEADRMMDMGFLPALRRILAALPKQRQTMLFSATFPDEIRRLAGQFMRDPAEVQIAARNSAATTVSHLAHRVQHDRKKDLLVHLLKKRGDQTLVFCRTKRGSDRLCRHLTTSGIRAAAIHGDKSQNARTQALRDFKSGRTNVLVATDIAARGLDIEQLPVVINFDMPMVAEDYIHRVGRTGRAGAEGQALSLVTHAEMDQFRGIQRLLKKDIDFAAVAGFEYAAS